MLFPLLVGAAALLSTPSDTARAVAITPATAPAPTVTSAAHAVVKRSKATFTADSLVVEKSRHTLTLYLGGVPVRTYAVALGKNPVGDKVKRGDGRTPEGLFFIDSRNAQSKYHLALHVSYPDTRHASKAAQLGTSPGGDIMVHGLPKAWEFVGERHRDFDWTEGCIAVTNDEIEEIWAAIPNGAPIQIKP